MPIDNFMSVNSVRVTHCCYAEVDLFNAIVPFRLENVYQ